MRGPCAKSPVRCVIRNGYMEFTGENDCANPQAVCPRAPGEDYTKCQTICQQAGHAEVEAVKKAGIHAKHGTAYLFGHYYACEPCARALRDAGVTEIVIRVRPA
jgi:deoxycytidylate deaminase